MKKYLTERQAKFKAEEFKKSGVSIEYLKSYSKLEVKRLLIALGGCIEKNDLMEDLRDKIYVMCWKK